MDTMQCITHSPMPHNHIKSTEIELPLYELSRGGYATIYESRLISRIAKFKIAIKCFTPRQDEELENLAGKIRNELRIWKILHATNSPNISPFLGVITKCDNYEDFYLPPWPVTYYYRYQNLNKYLRSKKPTPKARFSLLRAVISGLSHMHSLGIIHGDLKADNVLVDDHGVPRLCDFGTSRIECPCSTNIEDQYGTIQFDSPELFDGGVRTKQSDIWAFGCLALEVQFNKSPYVASYFTTCKLIRAGEPPARVDAVGLNPKDRDFQTFAFVWELIEKCWTESPEGRHDAMTIHTKIEDFLREGDTETEINRTLLRSYVPYFAGMILATLSSIYFTQ